MKNIIMLVVSFLLISIVHADQTLNDRQPREWELSTAQKPSKDYQGDTTAFTNVVNTGHNALGNPGYIALVAYNGTSGQSTTFTAPFTYYLWVQQNGKLMIASYPTLKTNASFPYGDWRSPAFLGGTVVGGQS